MMKSNLAQTKWWCVLALALGTVACGGGKPAENPTAPLPDGGEPTAASPDQETFGALDAQSDLTGAAKADYEDGFKAWSKGELTKARDKFRAAQAAASKSAAPGYALAIVLERLEDRAGAEAALRQAAAADPGSDRTVYALALFLAAQPARRGEAESYLRQELGRHAKSPWVLAAQSEVLSLQGDHAGAQKTAQEALSYNADFKEAMLAVVRDHYRAGKIELARYALAAMLDGFGEATPPRDKHNAEALLLRGLLERDNGRRSVAFAAFDAAARRRPDLVEAQIQAGSMKLEAGNAADAQPNLENAVKFAPKNAYARLNLGDCYRLLSRPDDAKREMEQALALDPKLATAHYDLGLLYLFSPKVAGLKPERQVQQAIDEFEKYKAAQPKIAKGEKSDVDELIARAKAKQAEIQAANAPPPEAAAQPEAAPSEGSP